MAKATQAAVDRSTLRLSEVARHIVVPAGIERSLWLGWDGQPGVEERVREFGYEFDRWQDGLAQVELGVTSEGRFAATVGGIILSIPRQVAKTFMTMVIVIALCSMFPNLTALWTAHRGRLSTQTFGKMKALAQSKALRKYLLPGTEGVRSTNGEQEIRFRNGSRIMFGAREHGFGLGFDEVDIEVFDEAQRLTSRALDDMAPATNQSRWAFGALLFFMGTPPRPTDEGEEFTNRRSKALAVKAEAGVDDFGGVAVGGLAVYVECSADPHVGQTGGPSLDDMHQVAIANPSYPHRTPEISVKRLREQLTSDDSWRREGLGVWDPPDDASGAGIPPASWASCADPDSRRAGQITVGIDMPPDRSRVNLAIIADREDGAVHGELIESRQGVAWLVARCVELNAKHKPATFVIDAGSPAGNLIADLAQAGIPLHQVIPAEYARACGTLHDLVIGEGFAHIDQHVLNVAVGNAKAHTLSRGQWVWRPRDTSIPISPLIALTNALAGHELQAARDPALNVW